MVEFKTKTKHCKIIFEVINYWKALMFVIGREIGVGGGREEWGTVRAVKNIDLNIYLFISTTLY